MSSLSRKIKHVFQYKSVHIFLFLYPSFYLDFFSFSFSFFFLSFFLFFGGGVSYLSLSAMCVCMLKIPSYYIHISITYSIDIRISTMLMFSGFGKTYLKFIIFSYFFRRANPAFFLLFSCKTNAQFRVERNTIGKPVLNQILTYKNCHMETKEIKKINRNDQLMIFHESMLFTMWNNQNNVYSAEKIKT